MNFRSSSSEPHPQITLDIRLPSGGVASGYTVSVRKSCTSIQDEYILPAFHVFFCIIIWLILLCYPSWHLSPTLKQVFLKVLTILHVGVTISIAS